MTQDQYNADLLAFLNTATTPFHAVKALSQRLEAAGFTRLSEQDDWAPQPGSGYFITRNDSSIIAFRVGSKQGPEAGLRMVGAHTDSPCLMVKPLPEKRKQGYQQLGVEVYGGALLNPWFDRDLSLAGRVSYSTPEGALKTALVDFRDPIAVIPSLAIHLDREVNRQRSINPQTDIVPLLTQSEALDFRELLAQRVRTEHPEASVGDVLGFELCLYDTQPAAQVGLDGDFIASARLDNLLSCFACLQALLASNGEMTSLMVCNDHEEVGSQSAAGAQGPMLRNTLERLTNGTAGYARMIGRSMMISADNAHGVHPNFADRHDDNHGPLLNHGPVIKVNANQRYASNSETAALFRQVCASRDIPVQSFVVRTDMACGSTIGPITAGELGVRTLDVGAPQFAMHSIRELAGARDGWYLSRALAGFMDWEQALSPGET
ncbi:MAG: M18 family aminopeptidase [Halieaceae bacterium]|jgi:aspartyl aminopeptidase|nr:M18 family aminopeptidase [Halieaceae bacterium]